MLTVDFLDATPGCNAGPSSAAVQLPGQDGAAPLSAQRAAYARALGLPAMLDLIRRVDNANEQVGMQNNCQCNLQISGQPSPLSLLDLIRRADNACADLCDE